MIQPIKSQTILDVFRQQSQLDKEMEQARLANILAGHTNTIKGAEAQYAPQMSQEELKKIQLFNMIQQAKAKYAEQNEQASLQDILSGTAGKNIRNQYLNQKMQNGFTHNQQGMQPGMEEFQVQPMNMKNAYNLVGLNAQLAYIKKNNANPLTGQVFSSPKELEQIKNHIRQEIDKKSSLTPQTKQFLEQGKTIKETINLVDFDRIKKYFGLVGRGRRAGAILQRQFGNNQENYEKFSQFMIQDAPSIANQMRFAFKDSVQKAAAHKYADLVTKDSWFSNPESAAASFKELSRLFDEELKSKLKFTAKGGNYRKVFSEYYPEFSDEENEQPNQEENINENRNVQRNQMSNQQGKEDKAMRIQKVKAEIERRKKEGLYNGQY